MDRDRRSGTLLSAALHAGLLIALFIFFRHPLSTQIVAAGEGEDGGDGAIEVGVVDAGTLGLSVPRRVTTIGDDPGAINNEILETVRPTDDAETLPSETRSEKPEEKTVRTERPTDPRRDRLVTRDPMRGSSAGTSVEVGRSSGTQQPMMSGGIGIGGGGASGASGVPGGSEYGRRIQLILSRNYNPPATADVSSTQYVVVELRIARDGRILSIVNGRLARIKRRSPIELVNFAAERAILASNPLPPFPNGFLLGAQEATAEIWFRYPK